MVELPPVKPHVTEYQQHSGWCERCQCFSQAELPAGVPKGAFGPRLMALVALLSGQYRLEFAAQLDRRLGAIFTPPL